LVAFPESSNAAISEPILPGLANKGRYSCQKIEKMNNAALGRRKEIGPHGQLRQCGPQLAHLTSHD
jgi:hypothetical protein